MYKLFDLALDVLAGRVFASNHYFIVYILWYCTGCLCRELNSNQISWTMEDAAGAFRGLTSLTKLGLRANAIRSIAVHAFAGLPKLRQLYLEDNDIASIQENAFETLRDLRDL